MTHPEWGYIVNGILADNVPDNTVYRGVRVLGGTEELAHILPENKMDEIVITLGLSEYHKLAHIVNMCEKSGVHTKFVPDYNNVIPTKPYTEDILGMPVINIRHVPLNSIDVYTSAGYMLRIDCWEAEKNLKTTPGSDCALTSLAVDEPLEYARLYLDGNLQMWVNAEDSLEI